MFQRLPDRRGSITLLIDGAPIAARPGDTVAAALVTAGIAPLRTTPVSGAPRAPYCMMGVCFDCLATIDGMPNRQTCMVTVREGMRIERQNGARSLP